MKLRNRILTLVKKALNKGNVCKRSSYGLHSPGQFKTRLILILNMVLMAQWTTLRTQSPNHRITLMLMVESKSLADAYPIESDTRLISTLDKKSRLSSSKKSDIQFDNCYRLYGRKRILAPSTVQESLDVLQRSQLSRGVDMDNEDESLYSVYADDKDLDILRNVTKFKLKNDGSLKQESVNTSVVSFNQRSGSMRNSTATSITNLTSWLSERQDSLLSNNSARDTRSSYDETILSFSPSDPLDANTTIVAKLQLPLRRPFQNSAESNGDNVTGSSGDEYLTVLPFHKHFETTVGAYNLKSSATAQHVGFTNVTNKTSTLPLNHFELPFALLESAAPLSLNNLASFLNTTHPLSSLHDSNSSVVSLDSNSSSLLSFAENVNSIPAMNTSRPVPELIDKRFTVSSQVQHALPFGDIEGLKHSERRNEKISLHEGHIAVKAEDNQLKNVTLTEGFTKGSSEEPNSTFSHTERLQGMSDIEHSILPHDGQHLKVPLNLNRTGVSVNNQHTTPHFINESSEWFPNMERAQTFVNKDDALLTSRFRNFNTLDDRKTSVLLVDIGNSSSSSDILPGLSLTYATNSTMSGGVGHKNISLDAKGVPTLTQVNGSSLLSIRDSTETAGPSTLSEHVDHRFSHRKGESQGSSSQLSIQPVNHPGEGEEIERVGRKKDEREETKKNALQLNETWTGSAGNAHNTSLRYANDSREQPLNRMNVVELTPNGTYLKPMLVLTSTATTNITTGTWSTEEHHPITADGRWVRLENKSTSGVIMTSKGLFSPFSLPWENNSCEKNIFWLACVCLFLGSISLLALGAFVFRFVRSKRCLPSRPLDASLEKPKDPETPDVLPSKSHCFETVSLRTSEISNKSSPDNLSFSTTSNRFFTMCSAAPGTTHAKEDLGDTGVCVQSNDADVHQPLQPPQITHCGDGDRFVDMEMEVKVHGLREPHTHVATPRKRPLHRRKRLKFSSSCRLGVSHQYPLTPVPFVIQSYGESNRGATA